ncbi:thiamine phosphate synthase [uncultured Amaricoccus sp.]|uniref:thiamine phosphate synthase n=1 Tax=uncultured Amaricoccus sp. TaxID=339341 RepID=UPI0026242CE6|nr:thiamine phosphate synthase [uncultured Amaricoccus sp.]
MPPEAEAPAAARLYLITPPALALGGFAGTLARLLDRFEIACVRLALATRSEEEVGRAADALREVCHARDVPLVIADHFRLVGPLGLDGVHLSDGARQVRAARAALGTEAIVGTYAHASRHDGMTAGELGADYVSFGPMTQSSLGDGALAPFELFQWWSELIELPVVAEGGLTPQLAADLAGVADFLALGEEIWTHADGPEAALSAFVETLGAERT